MDKRKTLRYIAIQLNSINEDLKDIFAELDFSEKEYFEINENVCHFLKKAIQYLETF